MFNQIRAEFYKLFHTRIFYITLFLTFGVFGIFLMGGTQYFMVSSTGGNTPGAEEAIGFMAKSYIDVNNPLPIELIRTAVSYTVFFWLILLIFTVIFFTREYAESTIKIAIASGQTRTHFFFGKYIIITVVSLFLYLAFITIAFLLECKHRQAVTTLQVLKDFFQIALLNTLAISAFINISIFLCVLIRHTAIVVGIMCFFAFSGPILYMGVWPNMASQPWGVIAYLKANPMYYLMNLCACNLNSGFDKQTFLYFVITTLITIIGSVLFLRKQEIH